MTIPANHSAVALLKLAQLPYNGASSLFIRVLLNKKYALPYKVDHEAGAPPPSSSINQPPSQSTNRPTISSTISLSSIIQLLMDHQSTTQLLQPLAHAINQSIHSSIHTYIHAFINQPIDQPTNQYLSQPTNHYLSQSTNESAINQPNNQPMN